MTKRRIGVRAIIFENGKLLANKFHAENGESTHWATPGGGLELGEGLTDGLAREIVEETGVVPQIGRLLFIQQFSSGRGEYEEELEFFFHVTNPADFMAIDLASTSHGMQEITRVEFIAPKDEILLPQFLQTVDIAYHIDTNAQPLAFNYLGV